MVVRQAQLDQSLEWFDERELLHVATPHHQDMITGTSTTVVWTIIRQEVIAIGWRDPAGRRAGRAEIIVTQIEMFQRAGQSSLAPLAEDDFLVRIGHLYLPAPIQ